MFCAASSETIGSLCCTICMRALDDLRLFEHLAGTLHFGRSAVECHITPSTLSRTITRLEAETGTRLFERDRRSVALTPEGARFLEFATTVLDAWRDFADSDRGLHPQLSGTVSLFCTVTASQTLVPDRLARFRESYPAVHLAIETGYAAEAIQRLTGGEVDVSIAAVFARAPRGLLAHVLTSMPFVLVTSADGGHQLPRAVSSAWAGAPFVLPATGLARALVDRWFRRLRVKPLVAAEANGHEAILALVLLGCGIGIVPELVVQQSTLVDRLQVLPVTEPMPAFDIAACTRPESLERPAARALWESLTT